MMHGAGSFSKSIRMSFGGSVVDRSCEASPQISSGSNTFPFVTENFSADESFISKLSHQQPPESSGKSSTFPNERLLGSGVLLYARNAHPVSESFLFSLRNISTLMLSSPPNFFVRC